MNFAILLSKVCKDRGSGKVNIKASHPGVRVRRGAIPTYLSLTGYN
jgi:hypothetical protein